MNKNRNYLQLSAILLLLATVVFAGYFAFVYFVKSVVPDITHYGLIFVSIIAGISMFFNPCSFTLLPGFLSLFYTKRNGKDGHRLSKTIYYGLIASIGIITFGVILGIVIGLLGESFAKSLAISTPNPNFYVRLFRGVIGGILISLGILHFKDIAFNLGFVNNFSQKILSPKNRKPSLAMYLYGFGYNALGIGCGGPIMAGLFAFAFSFGGLFTAIFSFFVYSLTMTVLMLFVSIIISLSKDALISKLRTSSLKIKKMSGIILALVGIVLLFSAIFTQIFVKVLFP